MVGRLVEDQQVWRVDGGEEEREAGLLPAGQAGGDSVGLFRADAEACETRTKPGRRYVGAQAPDVVEGRVVG